jgi:hypothetical protein
MDSGWDVYRMDCNSGFLTMDKCSEKGVSFDSEERLLTPNEGRRVAFLHQYNRYNASKHYVKNVACPL